MPKYGQIIDPITGQKITIIPEARRRNKPRSEGGKVVMTVRGVKESAAELAALRVRATGRILSDSDQRAASVQARLRAAILAAYHRADTGRMARGIRATVQKVGAPGGKVQTVIRITMQNYREARFLTNIGGGGYFKDFPVPGYRIYAKGAEGFDRTIDPANFGKRSRGISQVKGRRAAMLARSQTQARLKVPRASAFFTAARQPGRGGGESRIINDILGPIQPGDQQSHFFFYPLWVNHPGFPRDVISEVAIDEGARFKAETLRAATLSHGELRTISSVASRDIPIHEISLKRGRAGIERTTGFIDVTALKDVTRGVK